jgi:anaphase-promoting complex subunit 2
MDSSVGVMEEIKQCLDISNMLDDVTTVLVEETQRRLLIAGVMTDNIITLYINTVKTLQILDPEGYYFEKVITPIKKYLFKRPDVLRCIISLWIDDMENNGAGKKGIVKIPTFDEHVNELSSDDDEGAAENWEVHNVADKKKNYKRMRYKQSDLMVMLIDLYGSEEAFIQEYESMLAEKLLLNTKYNITEEIKNSELLKQRFGEAKLNRCNVIFKDWKDSDRFDKNLKND